jgi:hypothetical protein
MLIGFTFASSTTGYNMPLIDLQAMLRVFLVKSITQETGMPPHLLNLNNHSSSWISFILDHDDYCAESMY